MTAPSRRAISQSQAEQQLVGWFKSQGWRPAAFQREVWQRYLAGESGLLTTPTGSGKTLAALGGPWIEAQAEVKAVEFMQSKLDPSTQRSKQAKKTKQPKQANRSGFRLLWITPLRALASDTAQSIQRLLVDLESNWRVTLRTGDASAGDKRLARSGKADVLITTPESLSLLLSYPDMAEHFVSLRGMVVDEWHELMGSKRGVLLQLALARLRALAPGLRTWGLSATIGNPDEAVAVLLPGHAQPARVGDDVKPRGLRLTTLLPGPDERLPWAGHLGLSQLPSVLKKLLAVRSSLLFTNTRAQAELWHQALASVWPLEASTLALHHGSLDVGLRRQAEQGLREGTVRCVVATSSLDLGVDFPSVDQVLQIGSAKGVARLLQRAGRSRHRPGLAGQVVCVPSQAWDLLEYAAVRDAVTQGHIEPRHAPRLSLDVLAQHCVTLALGGGFDPQALYHEVRRTHAFQTLEPAQWQAVLDFIVRGGQALTQYPDYHRVVIDEKGIYRLTDQRLAMRHRLTIGTIVADGGVQVRRLRGGVLGSVDEGFISRLRPGDHFKFAGQCLKLVRFEDMTAYVRNARSAEGAVASWQGGHLPLSGLLGHQLERLFTQTDDSPERRAVEPLLTWQAQVSTLPQPNLFLIEIFGSRRGQLICLFPFAGRDVHTGLALLLAGRIAQEAPNTIGFAVNDHGLLLNPATPLSFDANYWQTLLTLRNLDTDLASSLNLSELARRQFREIARIAGLLPPSMPGRAPRSLRQLQVSSGLLYDVLRRYDPTHLLLAQADQETLDLTLNIAGLRDCLTNLASRQLCVQTPGALTPLAFPLWAEHLRGQLSNEDWQTRVRRAAAQLELRHDRAARRR